MCFIGLIKNNQRQQRFMGQRYKNSKKRHFFRTKSVKHSDKKIKKCADFGKNRSGKATAASTPAVIYFQNGVFDLSETA
jgi:hypothetical protein